MKRFAVLFGVVALATMLGGPSYGEAPQVRDMPDLALGSGDGLSGLPLTATDAYSVMDYVKDVDDTPASLTTSILNIQVVPGAGAGSPAAGGPSNVDIDSATQATGDVLVDVYGRPTAGWVQYTVRVDDASTVGSKGGAGAAAIQDQVIAKYATFDLTEPVVTDGVLLQTGGLNDTSRILGYYVVIDSTYVLYQLDGAIDPPTASVDWSVWVSDLIVNSSPETFDDNGLFTGRVASHRADGTDVSVDGISYSIDANGALTLTSGGSISPGPYIVGILATNQSDANDSDGTRVLVSAALLGEASPDTATVGASVTFDSITAGTIIPAATDWQINTTTANSQTVDGSVTDLTDNLVPGSHWSYFMSGPNDTTLDSVALTIVDLSSDGDLPLAAQLAEGPDTAAIAGGNAIKATLPPVSGTIGARGINPSFVQLPGFRLQSRAFTGISLTDVITFSLSVATDAADATDLPKYQLYNGSGFSGSLAGIDVRTLNATMTAAEGTSGWTRPQTNLPTAAQGWHRLYVTYAPGRTIQWFNLDGDTDMDSADLALLTSLTAPEGWDGANELSVVKCGLNVSSQQLAQNTVNVWLDNMTVTKSAYLLDLGLDNQALTTAVSAGSDVRLQNLETAQGFPITTTGNLDPTIEAYTNTGDIEADLDAIGYLIEDPGGNGPAFEDTRKDYIGDTDASMVTVGTRDHTLDGGSSKSLRVILDGDDGPDGGPGAGGDLDAIRAQVATGVVAGGGSGVYALEAYLTTETANNSVASFRHPQVRVLLQEVAPNWLGTASGVIFTNGGLPVVTDATPYNWQRCVAEMVIPNCEYLRGLIQISDTFQADVLNFQVPIHIDDITLYQVGDGAEFFDADLFDGA